MTGDPRADMARAQIEERLRVASERRGTRRRPPRDEVEQMARAAADGDAAAWDWLVARFHARLVSAARGQGLAYHDAEDAAQATWIRLTRHIGALREPASLPGWLITTARREGLRIRKRSPREELAAELAAQVAIEDDHDRGLVRELRGRAVEDALSELPERHRELMRALLSEAEPSYAEIAKRLGMPIGSIGPIRARSLTRLRRQAGLRELLDLEG